MKALPVLSGRKVVKVLSRVGFIVVRHRGSHIRLTRSIEKRFVLPKHKIRYDSRSIILFLVVPNKFC